MAKRNTTKNTRGGLGQWPGKGNWEHKKRTMTMAMAKRNATRNKRK